MDTHENGPLTPKGREAMVRSVIEGGLTKAAAARRFKTTAKTVAKWVERFRAEGVERSRMLTGNNSEWRAPDFIDPIPAPGSA
jgi:transposase